MDGTKRADIRPGLHVQIVLKQDQRSGKLTKGVVKDILTNSPRHPHGIKVRLSDGQVGRVKVIEAGGEWHEWKENEFSRGDETKTRREEAKSDESADRSSWDEAETVDEPVDEEAEQPEETDRCLKGSRSIERLPFFFVLIERSALARTHYYSVSQDSFGRQEILSYYFDRKTIIFTNKPIHKTNSMKQVEWNPRNQAGKYRFIISF